ncbi:MAG: hypothetical protein MUF21_03865 [Gemmatimonadaceae bacterium]|nr:hypothetical protein [Gemmatimonadaceae bacterium]
MSGIVLVDRADAERLAPLTSLRPQGALRAGARLVHERWAFAFGVPVTGLVAREALAGFAEPGQPPLLHDDDEVPAGTIVAWADVAPSLARVDVHADAWDLRGEFPVAMRVARATRAGALRDWVPSRELARVVSLSGVELAQPWHVIETLPGLLAADARAIAETMAARPLPPHVVVLGDHPVRIAADAQVEPFTLLDARAGAIVIEAGAIVRSHSRLVGPFVLCAQAHWLGGEGHTSVIGPHCKVHGEVSTSIVAGYANKAHDGFLGHSYLAPWSNLGAGTITSNLKNTYGTVQFAGTDTGLQFLGAIVGDHAKTGIGTRLTTGTRVGAGANVVGDGIAGPDVPPFAWGVRGDVTDIARFTATVRKVMARRSVFPSSAHLAMLARRHAVLAAR